MIIIWRGLGFLVAVIAFGSSLAANWIADANGGDGYYDRHQWQLGLSLVFSSVLCWYLAVYLRKQPGRVVIDKKMGQEFTLNRSHELFFIPVDWWPLILMTCALVAFTYDLFH